MNNLFWSIALLVLILPMSCNSQDTDKLQNEQDTVVVEKSNDPETAITEKSPIKRPAKVSEIALPEGYKRVVFDSTEFAAYLRNLELKTENDSVFLYDGRAKPNQTAQYAVLTIDVGTRDLQQCADAVMRLRGEYLYQQNRYKQIHFNFLSDGKPRFYTDYAKGDFSYKKFRRYMDYIYAYANTASLKNELISVKNPFDIEPGHVLIQTGRPYGHALTVMDMAKGSDAHDIIVLLSQSYMPAQDIHILRNPTDRSLSPWYKVQSSGEIITPEWKFYWSDLMRFSE